MAGRKKGSPTLTPLELEIMQVLWRNGPSNVVSVQKDLPSELAYTTVQTVLNVLHRKGRVRRTLQGRAYEYRPVTSKEKVVAQALRDLIQRMFSGSPEELVMSLVKNHQIDHSRLADLSREMAAEADKESDLDE